MTEKKEYLLYVQTSDNPERQYSPLILAQSAKAMDIDAKVYYLGQGLRVLLPETAQKIQFGTFPNLFDTLVKTNKMGIPIYVCEASKQMLGWESIELPSFLQIVGAATLNDLVYDAKGTMWF
ncbi:MAG: DsrE family protein [Candidatus Lokiarchaeota archaeon]|nr:DsrE family protein [Candidatus Harpocratesius repetitus]